jgi:hypothetical protein
MIQCDEARLICRPCLKGGLECGYELPAAQTRAQALNETRQHLQDELQVYTTLICALRCADSNTSVKMLDHLRNGDYDGVLLNNNTGSEMVPQADSAYPWDYLPVIDRRHLGSRAHMLPPHRPSIPVHIGDRMYYVS